MLTGLVTALGRRFVYFFVYVGEVAVLAAEIGAGLLEGGVLPVMKHIPGHGRATADSHAKLPVVDTDRAALEQTDFAAFRPLTHLPMAMTAHVVFTAIDNLVKGAAGQAVQNMNLMFGLDEKIGLMLAGTNP